MKKVEKLEDLEEGDRILFGDRKQPLEVESVNEEDVKIQGPNGGGYILYTEEDARHPLYSKPGNRKYSSYARKLRKVGKWVKEDQSTWAHSQTGAEIRIEENNIGYWKVVQEGIDYDEETPRYGFSNRESAEKFVEKIIRDRPEG